MTSDGIFKHKCVIASCSEIVLYDDEPWCYEHSPDSGSSLIGYSASKQSLLQEENK